MPITPAASELDYPRVLDHPWDHSPITVYIDNKSVPPHYSPAYYTQVQKALEYWEEGGNGKLEYTPVFKLVDSERADIRIRWVESLQKDLGAPSGVAGSTIPIVFNGRFVGADIMLGVGNCQWIVWIPYSDTAMLAIAKHELGHALGLGHSNDKQDVMYPTVLSKYHLILLFAIYAVFAIVVFLSVSYVLRRVTK